MHMYNWSTNENALKKDPEVYAIWKLEQMVNFGLGGKKIKAADLKKYWHSVTNISLSQFTKPYIRKGNSNLSKRKLLYGLVHIRYNDKKLLETIKYWIDEYISVSDLGRCQSGQMDQTVKIAASRRNSRWKSG